MAFLWVVVVLAVCGFGGFVEGSGFEVTIGAGRDETRPWVVRFCLENDGGADVHLLRWGTPFEQGLTSPPGILLDAKQKPQPYSGKYKKRVLSMVSSNNILELKKGLKECNDVDLKSAFRLDVGSFTFTPQFDISEIHDQQIVRTHTIHSDGVNFTFHNPVALDPKAHGSFLESNAKRIRHVVRTATHAVHVDVSCTAVWNITTMAAKALQKLQDAVTWTQNCPLLNKTAHLTRWMGAATQQVSDLVEQMYTRAITKMSSVTNLVIECELSNVQADPFGCDVATTAITDGSTWTTKMCDQFYHMPDDGPHGNGMDSRWGSIIHELTHFNDVGPTTDNAGTYGSLLCRNLAANTPLLAQNNADNFEYVIEEPNGPLPC
jgi:peptidyl-Lys metalloendopeptidase